MLFYKVCLLSTAIVSMHGHLQLQCNCKLIFLLCIQYRLFGVFPPSQNVLENIVNLSYLRQLFVCYFLNFLKANKTGYFRIWLFLRYESDHEKNITRIYGSRYQSKLK